MSISKEISSQAGLKSFKMVSNIYLNGFVSVVETSDRKAMDFDERKFQNGLHSALSRLAVHILRYIFDVEKWMFPEPSLSSYYWKYAFQKQCVSKSR